jgi:hypothetical protein
MAVAVAIAVVASCTGVAWGVSWPFNASGSNARFGWSGGEYNTGKFGVPIVTTAGFFFVNPNNFRSEVPSPLSTTDFARVTLDRAGSTPPGAAPIHFITVEEWGTYAGNVSDLTVQVDFQVFRFSPAPPGTTGPLNFGTGTGFITFNPNGTWSASRTLTAGGASPPFSNLDWNRLQVTVTNTIQVDGAAAPGSFIEKRGMRIIIPEPASMLLLLAGLGPIVLWRSRGR